MSDRVTINLRANQEFVFWLERAADTLAREIVGVVSNASGDKVERLGREVSKAALTEAARILTAEYGKALSRRLHNRHPIVQGFARS